MKLRNIEIREDTIAEFCRRNHISKLSLFGSALGDDFNEDSDVDLLVEFEPEHVIGLIKLAGLEIELSQMLQRKVDLRTPQDLSRYFRDDVLAEAETLYAQNDLIRLRHMLDAASEALSFSEGKSREDLYKNRMLLLAIVKELEIIGEAAVKITKETRETLPNIPWENIAGMRNRLIHAYFDINLDRVWDTVKDDLLPLSESLGQIIKSK